MPYIDRVVVQRFEVDHLPTEDEQDKAGGSVDWLDTYGSFLGTVAVSATQVQHDVIDEPVQPTFAHGLELVYADEDEAG
jgi:hypothetical protein